MCFNPVSGTRKNCVTSKRNRVAILYIDDSGYIWRLAETMG